MLHCRSLQEIAAQIQSGELSAVALTEYVLQRIAYLDPVLKSYATIMADQARAEGAGGGTAKASGIRSAVRCHARVN